MRQTKSLLFLLLAGWALFSTSCIPPQPPTTRLDIGLPRIDLAAVDQALWTTRASSPKDFQGWMGRFEDRVNAIYYATLRRQYPDVAPNRLMPQPVRVFASFPAGLLTLQGYIDQNDQRGFQGNDDILLFVLEQTKPYDQTRRLYYSLRDGEGYYYRGANHFYAWDASPPFAAGFLLYPTTWRGMYWRSSFPWRRTSYWNSGLFYRNYRYYYRRYPRYRRVYRRTYRRRYRPYGWKRSASARSRRRRALYRNRRRYRRLQRYRRSRYRRQMRYRQWRRRYNRRQRQRHRQQYYKRRRMRQKRYRNRRKYRRRRRYQRRRRYRRRKRNARRYLQQRKKKQQRAKRKKRRRLYEQRRRRERRRRRRR